MKARDRFTYTCEVCMRPKTIYYKDLKLKMWPLTCHSCRSRQQGKLNATHGYRKTRTYSAWRAMKKRCYQKSHDSYPRYGGRGITVCDRWKDSFENFLADMGVCPPNLTLERRNNAIGYTPLNCRWASWSDQAKNRRERERDEKGRFA